MSTGDPVPGGLPIDASDWDGDWANNLDVDEAVATPSAAAGLDGIVDFARGRLVGLVEDARDSLVSQVRGLKELADLLLDNLPEGAEPVQRLVGSATGSIEAIADALAEKSVEELVDDGRELVRAQPAAAVGVAIAVGFLAGRMLKAARD
ncbi:MAG: hypothetical protein MUE77_06095 [Sandarakinorhabdus sp.]|jgi:ElaB/YqjD/DUF883 family membrane-anchored ribosome-binding protein|nr:hypothetical protein [Sandarakinorhabdus sp.]